MDLQHTDVPVVEVRLPHRLPGDVMKCPWCQQYSMTYDLERNSWICHVYNGETYDEHLPERN